MDERIRAMYLWMLEGKDAAQIDHLVNKKDAKTLMELDKIGVLGGIDSLYITEYIRSFFVDAGLDIPDCFKGDE